MGIGVKNWPSFLVIFCTRSLTFYDNQDITLFISHNYVRLTSFCISPKLPLAPTLYAQVGSLLLIGDTHIQKPRNFHYERIYS